MYPENPEGTQVIVGSMNMGYISDTARNRTHDLFRPKREPIPLGHSDGQESYRRNPGIDLEEIKCCAIKCKFVGSDRARVTSYISLYTELRNRKTNFEQSIDLE